MNNPIIPPIHQSGRPLVSVGNGNTVKWGAFPNAGVPNNAWSATVNTVTGITFGSYQTPTGGGGTGTYTMTNSTTGTYTGSAPVIGAVITSKSGGSTVTGTVTVASVSSGTFTVTGSGSITLAGTNQVTIPAVLSVSVTGFSSYLLQATYVAKNNDASTRTLTVQFIQGSTAYSDGAGYQFTTGQIGTITNAGEATGLNPGLTYTFAAQINFPGSNGTVYNATLTVIGLG
jgi:hypothetical protein